MRNFAHYSNNERSIRYNPFLRNSSYGYRGEAHTYDNKQYLRARYYDVHSEVFIQEDSYRGTLNNVASRNRYNYGQNNPYKYSDPSGHDAFSEFGAGGGTKSVFTWETSDWAFEKMLYHNGKPYTGTCNNLFYKGGFLLTGTHNGYRYEYGVKKYKITSTSIGTVTETELVYTNPKGEITISYIPAIITANTPTITPQQVNADANRIIAKTANALSLDQHMLRQFLYASLTDWELEMLSKGQLSDRVIGLCAKFIATAGKMVNDPAIEEVLSNAIVDNYRENAQGERKSIFEQIEELYRRGKKFFDTVLTGVAVVLMLAGLFYGGAALIPLVQGIASQSLAAAITANAGAILANLQLAVAFSMFADFTVYCKSLIGGDMNIIDVGVSIISKVIQAGGTLLQMIIIASDSYLKSTGQAGSNNGSTMSGEQLNDDEYRSWYEDMTPEQQADYDLWEQQINDGWTEEERYNYKIYGDRNGTLWNGDLPPSGNVNQNIQGSGNKNIVGTNHNDIKPTQDWINQSKVDEYVARLEAGETLPSIQVYTVNGNTYILDGHHRYVASQITGIPVNIVVVPGGGPIGLPDWTLVISG